MATPARTIVLTSEAFGDGEPIPRMHTCDGSDVSPPLRWSGVPSEAVELALVVEDPDAPSGTVVHWVLWGMALDLSELAEGRLPDSARQGVNGHGGRGWRGPCPPPGHGTHRYFFTLYALGERLQLEEGATADQFRGAIEGSILAQGQLMGTYSR